MANDSSFDKDKFRVTLDAFEDVVCSFSFIDPEEMGDNEAPYFVHEDGVDYLEFDNVEQMIELIRKQTNA